MIEFMTGDEDRRGNGSESNNKNTRRGKYQNSSLSHLLDLVINPLQKKTQNNNVVRQEVKCD